MCPAPADERPHPAGPEPGWEELWHFDFVADDGSLGGFVRLTLRPAEGTAWYWAYLVGPRRPVVVVRDHELEPPRTRALEVRGPGLWAQVICETPLDHWSAGLEAAGVALDDPAEGWRGERGHPIPLGLDLEWEATGRPGDEGSGYCVPAVVHGEVLLGADRLAFQGGGSWAHRWGEPLRSGHDEGWWWAAGTFSDRSALSAAAPGDGWSWPADGEPTALRSGLDLAPDALTGDGIDIRLAQLAWAVVPLPGGCGLVRRLCSWSDGGKPGWGWVERLEPRRP